MCVRARCRTSPGLFTNLNCDSNSFFQSQSDICAERFLLKLLISDMETPWIATPEAPSQNSGCWCLSIRCGLMNLALLHHQIILTVF